MSGLSAPVYELIAMGLRYWLVFLAVVIIWRAVRLMQKDNRLYRRTLQQLPDAGLVGELVELETGKAFPLPREGMIGSGRASDIRLQGLQRRALEIVFRAGYGLRLIPSHRKHSMRLDGEAIRPGGDYALHGSVLEMGGRAYRFRLFEGLDVPELEARPAMMPDIAEQEAEEDVWSQQMVMDAPPPVPPGGEDDPLSGQAFPAQGMDYLTPVRHGFSEFPGEGGFDDAQPWQPDDHWEGYDGQQ